LTAHSDDTYSKVVPFEWGPTKAAAKLESTHLPNATTSSDVVKAIDKFYAEPENVPIPIVAQRIVVMGFAGETDQAIRDATLDLRKVAMRGKTTK